MLDVVLMARARCPVAGVLEPPVQPHPPKPSRVTKPPTVLGGQPPRSRPSLLFLEDTMTLPYNNGTVRTENVVTDSKKAGGLLIRPIPARHRRAEPEVNHPHRCWSNNPHTGGHAETR